MIGVYLGTSHVFHLPREKDVGQRKTHSKVVSNIYDVPTKVFLLTDHSQVNEMYINILPFSFLCSTAKWLINVCVTVSHKLHCDPKTKLEQNGPERKRLLSPTLVHVGGRGPWLILDDRYNT